MEYRYTKGEITRLIAESSNKNEFKPKMGDGVESGNKSENEKAYKDAEKRAKDYDGGLKDAPKEPEVVKHDGNKTMLSLNPETIDDKTKKRIKSQMKGYTSDIEEKNGIEKDPSAEFNEREYKAFKDEAEEMDKNIVNDKAAGLKASKLPKSTFEREELYEATKTVNFKRTKFLNEDHMISKIPDELKNEGQVFHMIDCADNDYTVRWSLNEAEVLNHTNKTALNESLDRMKQLFNYNPNNYGKYKKH